MARQGIYVNGKEILARYVGDKLVWQKKKWVYFKAVYFGLNDYNWSDANLNAVSITETQNTIYIPESHKFANLEHAENGAYKLQFDNHVEFILASIEIKHNRVNRRQQELIIRFYFQNATEKQSFENLVRQNIPYSIYARR